MFAPAFLITAAAFFITLELYRIPLGYNVAVYHILIAVAGYLGVLAFLYKGQLKIKKETRLILGFILVFAFYSFLSFWRNINLMGPEVKSMYLAEIIGYSIVIMLPLLITNWKNFKLLTYAFIASAIFIYLGGFWHMYVWAVTGEYVVGAPFWHIFSQSGQIQEYLMSGGGVLGGFPRFRLPFSSSLSAAIFLALAGILILSFILGRTSDKKGSNWKLYSLYTINFFTLLGTFSRTGWAIFVTGSLIVIFYFFKFRLVNIRKIFFIFVAMLFIFSIVLIVIPNGITFLEAFGQLFNPNYEWTKYSVSGHIKSRLLAVHYWTENPLVGIGVGGFFNKPGGGVHTHSTYFTLLVERGIIGLFLYLGILILMIKLLMKKMKVVKKNKKDIALTYNIALLGGIIGLCVGHLLYQANSEFVWMFYGIVLTYINLPFDKEG